MQGYSHAWATYWTIWFFVLLVSFLAPEIVALCTNWHNTLSAQIWRLEDYAPGQGIAAWSAFHFLFIGLLLLLDVWLLGHFGWHLWAS